MAYQQRLLLLFFLLLNIIRLQVYGSQTFSPVAVPLAVRTPYLNTWMQMQTILLSSNAWPVFWSQAELGWLCYIRVDGKTWMLFGRNTLNNTVLGDYAVLPGYVTGTELTPTRTIQVIEAGQINATVTFLSPIDPSDLVRQSLPFSYVALEFSSLDGQPHEVEVYSDISAEWLNGLRNAEVNWTSSGLNNNMVYHQVELMHPAPFQEYNSQASDGTAYYAMSAGQGRNISWQACQDIDCREEFIYAGGLNSKNSSTAFGPIDVACPVFAISVSLGNITSSKAPIVWSIGYVRDPSISYVLSGQNTTLRPFYTTKYDTTLDALASFVSSFSDALNNATAFDSGIRDAASVVSPDGKLFDMLCLVTRQVFSSLEITAPNQADSAARIFMKDMGSSRRVTPIESLYAALPLFLYYSPSLLKPLLVPLFEQQNQSSMFPYSAKDLGASFPVVSSPTLNPAESIDPTEDMLIIALAYSQYSNDTSMLHDYYGQLRNWAEYLIDAKMQYPDQLPLDNNSTILNSTNFAVKGIFAIQAMAEISHLVGAGNDSDRYRSMASTLISTWTSLALSAGSNRSVLSTFGGQQNAWSLPYNIYLQNMLGLVLLNDTVLNGLTSTYGSQIQATNYFYGLPSESLGGTPGNLAWNAWMATVFTDNDARSKLLDTIWRYTSNNAIQSPSPWPLGLTYNVQHGTYDSQTMSPALGGVFAPLIHRDGPSSARDSSDNKSEPVGAIVGGILGCLSVFLLIAGLSLWLIRRRRRQVLSTRKILEVTPFDELGSNSTAVLEKHESDPLTRQQMSTVPSCSHLRGPEGHTTEDGDPRPPSISDHAEGSRHEELNEIRLEIEALRTLMQSTHIELEPRGSTDWGAPPDYSSSRGDS